MQSGKRLIVLQELNNPLLVNYCYLNTTDKMQRLILETAERSPACNKMHAVASHNY